MAQAIIWSMAAMLCNSTIAAVRTRPQAILLPMTTMRKSVHGFPFPYMVMGLCWSSAIMRTQQHEMVVVNQTCNLLAKLQVPFACLCSCSKLFKCSTFILSYQPFTCLVCRLLQIESCVDLQTGQQTCKDFKKITLCIFYGER